MYAKSFNNLIDSWLQENIQNVNIKEWDFLNAHNYGIPSFCIYKVTWPKKGWLDLGESCFGVTWPVIFRKNCYLNIYF